MKSIEVFHIGPQKTGTTWVYRCFREHPGIECPDSDSIHYFDMNYHKGRQWYMRHFRQFNNNVKLFDPTYSYFRSPVAPERIYRENPDAKIIVCLRKPIERAFSHYWHEKKKMRFNFNFEEVLKNYDLYSNWVEPSFYFFHLEKYLQFFQKEQILVQFFDNLQKDPELFLKRILQFIEVDDLFRPSVLHEKINAAAPKQNLFSVKTKNFISNLLKKIGAYKHAKQLKNSIFEKRLNKIFNEKIEKLHQVNPKVIDELDTMFAQDISNLEKLLHVDLTHWRNKSN